MKHQPISWQKKVVFILFQVFVSFLIILLVEMTLRLFQFGDDLSLFKESKIYPGYYQPNPKVGKRFFTKLPATSSINDLFLVEKPDSCYRIFIMGGSTAQGFPYQSNLSFGRILNYRLQDAFPDKLIEVVNLAMVATNSYSQADFIDEVLKMKPDAILIYSGHNEYYGALGVGSMESGGNIRWMKKLTLKLIHLRTYQALQKIILFISESIHGNTFQSPTGTMMENIAREKSVELNSVIFNEGVEQFRKNMEDILHKANKKNVPVLIGELVSNVRDIKPFNSFSNPGNSRADSIYRLAQQNDSLSNFDKAKELYYQAKDLDAIRFRAPEALNDVIHKFGENYNITIVPVQSVFEANSKDGIIGNQFMLEHLHPNIDGYFLLADAYFNALRENGFIENVWNEDLCKSSSAYEMGWGYTDLDSLVGDLLVKKLMAGWPFQPDTVVNTFRFTYQPKSFLDSVAFMCIKYDDINVYNQHLELSKHFEESKNFKAAFEEINSLIKTDPHHPSLYLKATDLLLKANEPYQAAMVIKTLPGYYGNYNAHIKTGQCFNMAKDTVMAVKSFKKAVDLSVTNEEKENALILLYEGLLKVNYADAKAILTQLIKLDPKYKQLANDEKVKIVLTNQKVKPLLDSALTLARSNKLSEAKAILNQSLIIEETAFAFSMLGSIYFQNDKLQSFNYYQRAYQLNPNDVNTLNNLCVLSIMKKDFELAGRYLDELKLVSENPEQINGLSELLKKSRNASVQIN